MAHSAVPSSRSLAHEEGITTEMLVTACSLHSTARRGRDETLDDFLARATHIHLENKGLDQIGGQMHKCRSALSLYLQNNALSVLAGLESLSKLTHLYLQDNAVSELAGIGRLHSLQKLYLDGNKLSVVSGLEECKHLEELHVSRQHGAVTAPAGLQFDAASLAAVAPTLRVLGCADNRIDRDGVAALSRLPRLQKADLRNNRIGAAAELQPLLEGSPRLRHIEVAGNPLCHDEPRFADTLIVLGDELSVIDEREVTRQEREFLLRLHLRRLKRQESGAAASPSSNGAGAGRSPHSGQGDGAGAGRGRGGGRGGRGAGSGGRGRGIVMHGSTVDRQETTQKGQTGSLSPIQAMTRKPRPASFRSMFA
ncbi:unnamed protein product [Pedinophyceae sp. YPF-701]|nr:unnamed protein product [Pedinophyceae sp. YPF-701]